jgi:Fe-S-cluster containining protein
MADKQFSEDDLKKGFLFVHQMMNENQHHNFTSLSYVMSLTELLVSKGIIGINELDERKKLVEQRLMQDVQEHYTKVIIGEGGDKYSTADEEVHIDCEKRLQLCKAKCCSYYFYLTQQDIEENILQWDLFQPYCISRDDDGYCKHLDRKSLKCTVREQRPIPCRNYSCHTDKKIWLDFDKMIPAEEIETANS